MAWVSAQKLLKDCRDLVLPQLLDLGVRAVAGVPRSGLIPAAYLASLLHVPLLEAADGGTRGLKCGTRGRRAWANASLSNPVAVVDDSCFSGKTLQAYANREGLVTCAVYSRAECRFRPTVVGEELPAPRFFEWNLFDSDHMRGTASLPRGCALDFDGVVSHEDGVTPLFVPRAVPCRAIVTGRREVGAFGRERTEAWLARHEAKYDRLVMHPAASPAERGGEEEIAKWKAERLAELDVSAYVESSPLQARVIRGLWGGWVVCPWDGSAERRPGPLKEGRD